jgi:hypothetical protein
MIFPEKKIFQRKTGRNFWLDENEIKVILDGSEREITVKVKSGNRKNIFWIPIKISKKKFWEVSNSFR